MNLDLKYLQDEITALLVGHPELLDDDVLREDMIEGSTSAPEFVSQMLRKIGAAKALAHGTREYMAELRERVDRMDRREEALRQLIFKVMQTAGTRKMERPEATVLVKNGPPKVIITNEHEIPEDFWRVKREPDKLKIGAALKAHEFVPGCTLSNQEQVLSISTK